MKKTVVSKILGILLLTMLLSCSTQSVNVEAPAQGTPSATPAPAEAQKVIKLEAPGIPAKREFPVDETISPCQDFYSYTCHKVIDSFKLREDRSRHIFSFSDSTERLLEAKKMKIYRSEEH